MSRKEKHNVAREDAIVVNNKINSLNECYTTLKDNLLFYFSDNNCHIVQVESSLPGEGKTTLTCNLAVSLGLNNKKVLVIDLDFRKPQVNRLFNLSNNDGLVDLLGEKITIEKAIKHTEYENVDVISRGSSVYNPSFLLTSSRLKELLEELRKQYDFILLDSPPVLLIADYIHISRLCDGVVFVVAFGRTKRKSVLEASKLLRDCGANVIGTAMTFVDKKDPYVCYGAEYNSYYSKTKEYATNEENVLDEEKSK